MPVTPVAVLSLKQKGSGQFASVNRLGGNTNIQVGLNFSVLVLTSTSGTFLSTTVALASDSLALPTATIAVASTAGFPGTGTFYVTSSSGLQLITYTGVSGNTFTGCTGGTGVIKTGSLVGEQVTGGTSGTTAFVAQVLASGGTTTLFLNAIAGAFTGTETVTGGISAAHGSFSTCTILESPGTSNETYVQDRVLQFNGNLYAGISNYVLKSPDDQGWFVVYTNANLLSSGNNELNCRSGLHQFTVGSAPLLGFLWGGANGNNHIYRATSVDGTTWTSATLATGSGINGTSPGGVAREIVWNNVLYFYANFNSGSVQHASWDPSTDTFSSVNANSPIHTPSTNWMVFKNQLIALGSDNTGGYAGLYNFVGGAYVRVLQFTDTGNINSITSDITGWTIFDAGDGLLTLIYYSTSGGEGWVVRKVSFNNGVWTDLGQIQAQFLAGTGIAAYPGGTATRDSRFFVMVDNTTNPGTPQAWLYYSVSDGSGNTWLVASVTLPTENTTISVASNGAALPQATINVASTAGFPASGTILVVSSSGVESIAYTGVTPTSFTGCSGGAGNLATGNNVNYSPPIAVLGSGGDATIVITESKLGGGERIWGPGQPDIMINAVTGVPAGEQLGVTIPRELTQVAAASNGAVLPQATVNVGNTYGFSPAGGVALVAVGTNTTIAVGSNGVSLPSSVINVASTAGFPTSGTIFVVTSTGTYAIQYQGTTLTTFIGCTGGIGAMATGGVVTLANSVAYTGLTPTALTGCTGGTGTLSTGGMVMNTRTVAFWWSQTGELELSESTLITPGRGVLVGKTITQVPADGSQTIITWNAGVGGDAIINLTATNLQPDVIA